MKTNIEQTAKLVKILKKHGYTVYLGYNKEYGFFYKDENKLISFQIDYFFFHFASNHKSKGLGTGARLTSDEQCVIYNFKWAKKSFFENLLDCDPYRSRKKNEFFIKWTTLEEHLKQYQASSKFEIQ